MGNPNLNEEQMRDLMKECISKLKELKVLLNGFNSL